MAITPADIEQLTFSPSKHGYDTGEVDNFLEQLSGELDAMLQKIADLKGRLNKSEQALSESEAKVAQLEAQVSKAPAAAAAPSTSGVTEQQISQALIVAQQSAEKIVGDAREAADRVRADADAKAREIIRQALAEKQNELDEIDRLKQSREDFRSEYKSLLQRFMDDAVAAFPNQVLTQPASEPAPRYDAPVVDANTQVYTEAAEQAQSATANEFEIDDLD